MFDKNLVSWMAENALFLAAAKRGSHRLDATNLSTEAPENVLETGRIVEELL